MDYLLKSSAVILLFYGCYVLFLKRETFFESNRWFLLTGLVLACLFPLISIPNYIEIEASAPSELFYYIPEITATAAPEVEAFDWLSLIPILYAVGIAGFFIQLFFQFISLVALLLKNLKQKEGGYTYVIVKRNISPFSFFKWIVYNPDLFNPEELKLIMNHEKVHVRQFHSIDILLTRLMCIVFWWNPIIWLYKKDIEQNLEFIADAHTQKTTTSKKDYQHLLLKASTGSLSINLTTNFYNSLIKKRILMLNKARSKSISQFKTLLVLPLLTILLMSVNTEAIYVEIPAKNSENNLTTPSYIIEENESDSPKLIEVIFTKETSDIELNKIENELNAMNIEMIINKIKRNKDGIITTIDISFEGSRGKTNYQVKNKNGIPTFIFKQDDVTFGVVSVSDNYKPQPFTKVVNDTIWVKNFNQSYSNLGPSDSLNFIYPNYGFNTNYFKSKHLNGGYFIANNPRKAIYNSNSSTLKKSDSLSYTASYSYYSADTLVVNKPVATGKMKNNTKNRGLTYFDVEPVLKKSEASDRLNSYLQAKDKPLFVLDNKIVSQEKLMKFDSNKIKAMTVLKSEKAMNIYGDRAKYGAVVIETYDKTKKPWAFTTGEVVFYEVTPAKTDISKSNFNYRIQSPSPIADKPAKNKVDYSYDIQVNQVEATTLNSKKDVEDYIQSGKKPLVIVDDIMWDIMDISSGFDYSVIEKISLINGKIATEMYGEKAKDGAIMIITKEAILNAKNIENNDDKWSMTDAQINSIKFIDDEDSNKNAILYFVSKKTTDDMLDSYKRQIKAHGITVKYSKLKRDVSGVIVQIKINIKDANGNETSATFSDDKGIKTIRFGKSENGLVVNTKPIGE